jgi:methylated-DNA-[protein]-cysteine S-methyltransferase
MTARHATTDTQLGQLTLVADGSDLTGLYFPGHWTRPDRAAFGPEAAQGDDALFARAAEQLAQYLAGERTEFELPAATHGSPFEERVWALLKQIPYGSVTTYGALASELGAPGLAQDVGRAVGRNPLSLIVPCHRVIGANGKLTGYAGGLPRKQFLLELEQAIPAADSAAARRALTLF